MAFGFTDGFDSYAATVDLTKKWLRADAGWVWGATSGRTGAGGLTCTGSAQGLRSPNFLNGVSTNTTFVIGWWMKLSGAPSASNTVDLFGCFLTSGSTETVLRLNTSGQITFCSTSGAAAMTGSANVCDNNWHWCELKWYDGNGAATTTLYVDDRLDMSGSNNRSNVNTLNGFFFQNLGSVSCNFNGLDDVIFYYDAVSANYPALANHPLGQSMITTLRPNADSAVQFTPDSGATNYSRVNEVNSDEGLSYVQDGTSGHQDLYDFDDMPFTPSSIRGVNLTGRMLNTGTGTTTAKLIAKNNVTQTDGAAITLTPNYATWQQSFGLDPNTGSQWASVTALNAAKFGIKVP